LRAIVSLGQYYDALFQLGNRPEEIPAARALHEKTIQQLGMKSNKAYSYVLKYSYQFSMSLQGKNLQDLVTAGFIT